MLFTVLNGEEKEKKEKKNKKKGKEKAAPIDMFLKRKTLKLF